MINPRKYKKVDVIVDLQYGSTGKGLIAGFMAKKFEYDVVMTANMPNAGHTFVDANNREWIHKVLPNGIVSPGLETVMIGPGAIFDPDRLFAEIDASSDILKGKVILIHPNACVLDKRHKNAEKAMMSGISSTMQGSAAAMTEKIARSLDNKITAAANADMLHGMFMDLPLVIKVCTHDTWAVTLISAKSILLEGAQGYSLGINGKFYPYCTSRECTPARFMSDCGVPLPFLRRVVGTARVHPIRVGSTPDGYSGDCYDDQGEISWEELGQPPETTTVTGRIRRVFTFSSKQMRDSIFETQPDWIFLNFCNYDPALSEKQVTLINSYLNMFTVNGGKVMFTGWGPKETDVKIIGQIDPCDFTREEHAKGHM